MQNCYHKQIKHMLGDQALLGPFFFRSQADNDQPTSMAWAMPITGLRLTRRQHRDAYNSCRDEKSRHLIPSIRSVKLRFGKLHLR